jgi:hypothetical protein
MSHHEFELSVGDVIQIGEYTVTVIDLENGEVTFRIQDPDGAAQPAENPVVQRPR